MTELKYTKDGVPIFDGSPDAFTQYKRAALLYCETVEWKKRSLVGPRLQSALEGSAKTAVEHMPATWLSHDQGAMQLLNFLRGQVRPPSLAEAGRSITRFFYAVKRRKGEGMSAWIVRHDEALLEVKRTLAEAIQEYGPPESVLSRPWSRGWSGPGQDSTPRRTSSQVGSFDGSHRGFEAQRGEEDDGGWEAAEQRLDEPNDEDERHSDASWGQWQWGHWNWQTWDKAWAWNKSDHSHQTWDASASASGQADKFLPDFVVAWLLLQRSGLDSTEKSVIVANLQNKFTTEKVKEALKLTWPDEDLRRRDTGRQGAYLTAEEEALMTENLEENMDHFEAETEEEHQAYAALEDEARSAMAALQDARRTLRDAREKQSMMRKNRSFFPGSSSSGRSGFDKPPIKCFKCGGPHMRKDCPKETAESKPKQVHFVFQATQDKDDVEMDAATAEPKATASVHQCWAAAIEDNKDHDHDAFLSLQEIVAQGKAIVDGGATSTLGSEGALQRIAQLQWQRQGQDNIEIVAGDQPSFRFGNNGRTTCMSTALVGVNLDGKPGRMQIHVHDIENQPVLLSIKALKTLGAVVDYGRDEIVLTKVNPYKVARLETTESGHQLFPLVDDVLQGAFVRQTPFVSLSEPEGATSATE
ncbi:DHX9 [Symbiodinium natans]|uniref:DHX9 protein n=1 Tax=Symbiodinium natans TaxID=878477 RepID=A0A812JDT9_9DINO|nr:DHX9 [Symbiodinium natans]